MKKRLQTIPFGKVMVATLIMPMTLCVTMVKAATTSSAATMQNTNSEKVKIMRINPTTVELIFPINRRVAIDFYGNNIFRIFESHNDEVMKDPEAKPMARILTDNPRTKVETLNILEKENEVTLSTEKVKVVFDKTSALFKIINTRNGKIIAEECTPALFANNKVTLSLHEKPDEYYFGGGVQNGHFSHKGEKIEIVNTNNWVDGGVASPAPFYWSTAVYGFMW